MMGLCPVIFVRKDGGGHGPNTLKKNGVDISLS